MGTVLKAVSFFYNCTFLATAPWEGIDYGAPTGIEVLDSECTNIPHREKGFMIFLWT